MLLHVALHGTMNITMNSLDTKIYVIASALSLKIHQIYHFSQSQSNKDDV